MYPCIFSFGHLCRIILPGWKCFPEMHQHFLQYVSQQISSCLPLALWDLTDGSCGSRAECWGHPRHLPSEQGIEDAPLCITFALGLKSLFVCLFVLKPKVVVLLGHRSHLNLPLRNVFGFILVIILFSKSYSVTTNFPVLRNTQCYGISHWWIFSWD